MCLTGISYQYKLIVLTVTQIDKYRNVDVSVCMGYHLYMHSLPLLAAGTRSNDIQKQWEHPQPRSWKYLINGGSLSKGHWSHLEEVLTAKAGTIWEK